METEILDGGLQKNVEKAAKILKNGGLVAIPTETVYGLAADALNPDAVAKIFKAKGRPMDNPLIVHICRFEEIYRLVKGVPHKAKELADRYWPGPLTIILPKSDIIPKEVSAELPTVAVRMPSHPVARAIIEKTGRPLAAPSANSSGLPSPTTAKHVMDDMNGKIDAIVDGGSCDVGIESTVVTLATDPPRLLRPGGITHEQLEEVLGHVDIDPAVLSQLKEGERPASPGMKYWGEQCILFLSGDDLGATLYGGGQRSGYDERVSLRRDDEEKACRIERSKRHSSYHIWRHNRP